MDRISVCPAGANTAFAAHTPADLPDHVRTIAGAIAYRAKAGGERAALVGVDCPSVSYAQLLGCIDSIRADLAGAGLRREDRVALLVPPGLAGGQLAVALACSVTLVPVNPALTPDEILEFLAVSGARAVVVPSWVGTPAGAALAANGTTVLAALRRDDGTLALRGPAPAVEFCAPLRPARAGDIALVLRSSGTTGAPKLIPVSHGNLLAMAARLGSGLWFNLGANDRAVCTLPLHYAAGLKTTLFVPLILGASVGFPPPGKALALPEWIDALKPTYLSVAPGPLVGILDRVRAAPRPFARDSLRFVMCAAAYLPEEVRLSAQALLGVPVLEFYGLSEAGVMAANPVPPGKVKPGTVGLPAPRELRIVDANGRPVAAGTVGHILISGPTVTPGYLVTRGSGSAELKDGWLLSGDLGRIDEDGYLTIAGRVSEVINRGGEKVFPYEVEKALLQHPAVLEGAAFGVPHPRLGESVAAAVVLKPGAQASEQELKDFLGARLAAYKLPRRLWVVADLPRGNTGKVLRKELGATYATSRHEVVAPDRLLELELRDIWERLLVTDDIGIDDDFFEIGGDSLLATEMLLEVEALAGKPYPQSELATLTIRRMSQVLTSAVATQRDLVTQVRTGPGIPLFFCHGDYVTRGIYAQQLAKMLPNDRPVHLLNCPADGPIGASLEAVADAYLQDLLRIAPRSPVMVGGYCNGGLVAWQLAHLLRARGVDVAQLLLVETMSLNARPELRLAARVLRAAAALMPGRARRVLGGQAMGALWLWRRSLGGLSYRTVRAKLLSPGRRAPASGLRQDAFDTADEVYFGLMSRYLPPPVDIDVTCFIADEGRHFDTAPSFWRRLAPHVDVVAVPGTHHTAVISGRQALAAALCATLKRAAARSTSEPAATQAADHGFRET